SDNGPKSLYPGKTKGGGRNSHDWRHLLGIELEPRRFPRSVHVERRGGHPEPSRTDDRHDGKVPKIAPIGTLDHFHLNFPAIFTSTCGRLTAGAGVRLSRMLCGRIEKVTRPDNVPPFSIAPRGTVKASNAISAPMHIPSTKLERPMKPATKRVFGLVYRV